MSESKSKDCPCCDGAGVHGACATDCSECDGEGTIEVEESE